VESLQPVSSSQSGVIFRYALDPLCLLACFAYALNRVVIEPSTSSAFFHGTFNDLFLIPAALPPVLWLQRLLGWRAHDLPPTPAEIFGHWLIWSVVCEGLGPLLFPRAVADWRDVIAYAAGALVAGLWWNRASIADRSGFDFLAPHYDVMEAILAGKKLHLCRVVHLTGLPVCREALLVGEGHGRFLVELLKSQPEVRVTFVDSSAGMLGVARARLRRAGLAEDRVTFLQKNLLEWTPPTDTYDLIVTNFFLDCFTAAQLEEFVPRLGAAGQSGAHWLVADFQIPSRRGWHRFRAVIIHWLMYRFFRIVTRLPARFLAPPAPWLEQQGFVLEQRREYNHGLLYAESWKKTLLPSRSPSPVIGLHD